MAATTISTMPPPSRDHILDLPNELFDMMLARLDWDEIYVFYMTRKKHDAAKAALWPRYCTEGLQIWDHEQTFLEANARKEMRKPERLLHSILSNPDVGSELRELFLAVPSARQAQPHPSDSPSQVPRLDMPTWWSSIFSTGCSANSRIFASCICVASGSRGRVNGGRPTTSRIRRSTLQSRSYYQTAWKSCESMRHTRMTVSRCR